MQNPLILFSDCLNFRNPPATLLHTQYGRLVVVELLGDGVQRNIIATRYVDHIPVMWLISDCIVTMCSTNRSADVSSVLIIVQ